MFLYGDILHRSETFHISSSNNWNKLIYRNLNSCTLNVQEFKQQYLDFYVPSFIPSVTRTQGRKCQQLVCKFKKTRKYWNLKNVVDHSVWRTPLGRDYGLVVRQSPYNCLYRQMLKLICV
jgi:hypothetical protein